MKPMSPAMRRALTVAANRERGNFCPVPGVHSNAETMLLAALDRRGYIKWDNPEGIDYGNGVLHYGAPRISDAGRAALKEQL